MPKRIRLILVFVLFMVVHMSILCFNCGESVGDLKINVNGFLSSQVEVLAADTFVSGTSNTGLITPKAESGYGGEALGMSMPSATGIMVKENEKSIIDYSNANDGYVMVKLLKDPATSVSVIIQGPSGRQYIYNLIAGDYEVFNMIALKYLRQTESASL